MVCFPHLKMASVHCFNEPVGAACGSWKSRVTQCGIPRQRTQGPFRTALYNFRHRGARVFAAHYQIQGFGAFTIELVALDPRLMRTRLNNLSSTEEAVFATRACYRDHELLHVARIWTTDPSQQFVCDAQAP